MKAWYRVKDGIEWTTDVDTMDVGVAATIIRKRFNISEDTPLTVRIPMGEGSADMDPPTRRADQVQEWVNDQQDNARAEKVQQRIVLTSDQLGRIHDAITDDGEVAGILMVWEVILGGPLADDPRDKINPNDYALSEAQWQEIAGYMVRDSRTKDPSYEGIPGFTMVNQGPSSYEDEPLMGANLPPKRPGTVAIEDVPSGTFSHDLKGG